MGTPLAPGLLLASPPLGDPNFNKTVVVLALHGDHGALGFVINRVAPLHLGELFRAAGYGEIAGAEDVPIYSGGPVQPSSGWIICDDPTLVVEGDGVIPVGDRVRVTSSRSAFDRLAREAVGGPTQAMRQPKRIVILGYSGWGPGQLEGEIASGAWLPAPLDASVLFDVDVEDRWERAYAGLGLQPAAMMTMRTVGEA